MTAIRRIHSEFNEVQNAKPGGLVKLKMFYTAYIWKGCISLQRAYKGANVDFCIRFPVEYPFRPPRFRILADIYHPNVKDGEVCFPLVDPEYWHCNQHMLYVIKSFIYLINYPDPERSFNSLATYEYKYDKLRYYGNVYKRLKAEKRDIKGPIFPEPLYGAYLFEA